MKTERKGGEARTREVWDTESAGGSLQAGIGRCQGRIAPCSVGIDSARQGLGYTQTGLELAAGDWDTNGQDWNVSYRIGIDTVGIATPARGLGLGFLPPGIAQRSILGVTGG